MRDGESEMGQVAFPHQWVRLHFGDWIFVIIIEGKAPTHDFGCIQQIIVLRERERERETCDL